MLSQILESGEKNDLNKYLDDELRKIWLSEAKDVVSVDEAIEMYNEQRSEIIELMTAESRESSVLREQDLVERLDQEALFDSRAGMRVVCPLCFRANLEMRARAVECPNHACRFRMNTAKLGVQSLGELSARLLDASQHHTCSEVPKFMLNVLDDPDDADSLFICCDVCGYIRRI